MLTLLLLAASAQLAAPLMTFSRAPSFEETLNVTVEVGMLRGGDRSDYWFKRVLSQRKAKSIVWTDTFRCPAARTVLIAARKLKMPQISVEGLESDQVLIVADGVGYRLTGQAEYEGRAADHFEIQSNVGTPLARWVDDSLQALESCWSREPPANR